MKSERIQLLLVRKYNSRSNNSGNEDVLKGMRCTRPSQYLFIRPLVFRLSYTSLKHELPLDRISNRFQELGGRIKPPRWKVASTSVFYRVSQKGPSTNRRHLLQALRAKVPFNVGQ